MMGGPPARQTANWRNMTDPTTPNDTAPSAILEPIERILGFEIEACTNSEIKNLSRHELELIAEAFDESLVSEAQRIGPLEGQAVMIADMSWCYKGLTQTEDFLPATLLHRRVLVPMDEIGKTLRNRDRVAGASKYNYDAWNVTRTLLKSLRLLAPLLRSGAVFPFSESIHVTRSLQRFSDKVAAQVNLRALSIDTSQYEYDFDDPEEDESSGRIRQSIAHLHTSLFCARKWDSIPFITEAALFELWKSLAKDCLLPDIRANSMCVTGSTLFRLPLPKITKLPVADIVALHKNSQAFADWREKLSQVLRSVHRRICEGEDTNVALREELWPLKDFVRQIDRELSSRSLRERVGDAKTTFVVGLATLLMTYPILASLGIEPGIEKDFLKLGPAVLTSLLWPILFGQPKQDAHVVSNLYHALI
jgi:hypothetical protein